MYIIVGLGNPGKKYEHTRHNVGFDVIDRFAEKHDIKVDRLKHKALIGEGRIAGEKVVLIKPQTYMNLSGESLISAVNFYKPDMDKVVVVYDDIDIDIGHIRIRKKGSAGSHNGMKSIISNLSTQDFPRFRVGVGRPESGRDLADFVLSRVSKTEEGKMMESIDNTVSALEVMIESDLDLAMNRYNG